MTTSILSLFIRFMPLNSGFSASKDSKIIAFWRGVWWVTLSENQLCTIPRVAANIGGVAQIRRWSVIPGSNASFILPMTISFWPSVEISFHKDDSTLIGFLGLINVNYVYRISQNRLHCPPSFLPPPSVSQDILHITLPISRPLVDVSGNHGRHPMIINMAGLLNQNHRNIFSFELALAMLFSVLLFTGILII